MSENPLLPHHKLRELHQKMLEYRKLERKQRQPRGKAARSSNREALLAVTAMHLQAGDLLCASDRDRTATQRPTAASSSSSGMLLQPPPRMQRIPMCAAAARGMQAAGKEALVLVLARAGDLEPGWQAAMEWAQDASLPLLLLCEDASSGLRSDKSPQKTDLLNFESISKFAKRTKLPVLPVDGEDAVAIFRVVQECVLRARMGGGPAVVWAVLNPIGPRSAQPKRSATPLARLQSYMSARSISFGKAPV